ncbi:MAG TPA: transcriptional regulator [Candidatus Nesterenkonia stercoripullorum]|uniref:Transcriptional regulator n=1 Tax=Candidatus Nesterenkonia stercoripullorum TaxID=2838701 RepID=A0A9D1UTJ1_9MICC|nr:transcriptional regulator [Candidatus Nesterenkonia stercoripullorum]
MTDEPTGNGLDPLIHEIARLRICATLAATTAVEAQTLKAAAGISDSSLSKHLRRLADAGYISLSRGKSHGPGRPRTWVSLSERGRTAYTQHLAALQRLTQAL